VYEIESIFLNHVILCDFHRKHVILKASSLWEIKMEMLAKFSNLKIRSRSVNLTIRFHLVPHLRIRGLVPQVLRTSAWHVAYLSKGTKVIFIS